MQYLRGERNERASRADSVLRKINPDNAVKPVSMARPREEKYMKRERRGET
jgi:hypothetical protein